MRVYVGELTFLSFLALLFLFARSMRSKKFIFFLGCMSLILLASLRNINSTVDTVTYINAFFQISRFPWSNIGLYSWEAGYVFLNKLLGYFIHTDRQFIVTMTLITLIPSFVWIWKNCQLPCLGLAVFMGMGAWETSMSLYRHWIALLILIYSVPYIQNRRFFHFAAMVLVAMSFHRTAIVFLIVYFLYKLSINIRLVFLAYIGAAALPIIGRPLLQSVIYTVNRYQHYVLESDSGYFLFVVLFLVTIVSYFLKIYMSDDDNRTNYIMVFTSSVLQTISIATFSLWSRVVLYFEIYLIPLLANVVFIQGRKRNSIKQVLIWNTSLILIMFGWMYLRLRGTVSFSFMWN